MHPFIMPKAANSAAGYILRALTLQCATLSKEKGAHASRYHPIPIYNTLIGVNNRGRSLKRQRARKEHTGVCTQAYPVICSATAALPLLRARAPLFARLREGGWEALNSGQRPAALPLRPRARSSSYLVNWECLFGEQTTVFANVREQFITYFSLYRTSVILLAIGIAGTCPGGLVIGERH
jgi:hypothetical protein